jgi:lipopolysaccharide/colanic/teichoic acid biosynthesis glycosyltransferase
MKAKRIFDIGVSLALLALFSPVMLATALLVRLFMGGPVIFTQERPGRYENPFRIYKFRTMKDLRDTGGRLLPDIERITRFGSIMRKLSLDEFPQLINVLKGDMSLVGPRPLLMKYLPYYTERERMRFKVRPGITGLAQISGRNSLNWNERLELDARYVEKWTFPGDIRILWKTVMIVFRQEGVALVPDLNEPDLDNERTYLRKVNA